MPPSTAHTRLMHHDAKRLAWNTATLIAVLAAGCAKRAEPAVQCFDASAGNNSPAATVTFKARQCQAGGATWSAILQALARRRGRIEPADPELAVGWAGGVQLLNGKTLFSIDDEADNARFCSQDLTLVAAMRRDYELANRNEDELRRVMSEASTEELECLDEPAR